MRTLLLAGAASAFLTGAALAETSVEAIGPENEPLLPPVLALTQPSIANTGKPGARTSVGTPLRLDLGSGFKTEVEGSTLTAIDQRLGNLPTGGGISGTGLMFNGLYELTDGAWHLRPYVGAGLGMVDANARILLQTSNDWVTAYQLHGGVTLGFTQKLVGSLEYRWTAGSKPAFMLAGIPAKVDINQHGFFFGMNYKY